MGLESLKLLSTLINLTGMMPFRMILDKKTNRFKRFDFGWRHPITWWCVLTLLAQLIYAPVVATTHISIVLSKENDPIIYMIIMSLWQISYYLSRFIPSLLLFHTGQLKLAFKSLEQTDLALQKIPQRSCFSRRYTLIGLVVSIIWTVLTDALASSSYIGDIYEKIGLVSFVVLSIVDVAGKLQLLLWFTLVYVIYHNIAHRIAILTSLVGELMKGIISINRCGLAISESAIALANNKYASQIQSLRRISCLLNLLAFASYQIENVFSFPALFVITTSFFSCTTSLFLLIHEFVQPSVSTMEACFQSLLAVSNIIMPLIIILSAALPAKELKILREQVLRLSIEIPDLNDNAECTALLMSLSEDRVQLSAGGLFIVGKHLVPPLAGTIITYLVILLQNTVQKKGYQNSRMMELE